MDVDEALSRIQQALAPVRIRYACEKDLQIGIAETLTAAGVPFEREVYLNAKDRVDFRVAKVGVEVKTEGSVTQVTRQLHRYAQSSEVEAIVLVTDKAKHRAVPRKMNGKTVEVIWIPSIR